MGVTPFTSHPWKGAPVKIWGFFGNGKLQYYVLPKAKPKKKKKAKQNGAMRRRRGMAVRKRTKETRTTHMNQQRYQAMVKTHVKSWVSACWGRGKPQTVHLVQDHERCLWVEKSLEVVAEQGLEVVDL